MPVGPLMNSAGAVAMDQDGKVILTDGTSNCVVCCNERFQFYNCSDGSKTPFYADPGMNFLNQPPLMTPIPITLGIVVRLQKFVEPPQPFPNDNVTSYCAYAGPFVDGTELVQQVYSAALVVSTCTDFNCSNYQMYNCSDSSITPFYIRTESIPGSDCPTMTTGSVLVGTDSTGAAACYVVGAYVDGIWDIGPGGYTPGIFGPPWISTHCAPTCGDSNCSTACNTIILESFPSTIAASIGSYGGSVTCVDSNGSNRSLAGTTQPLVFSVNMNAAAIAAGFDGLGLFASPGWWWSRHGADPLRDDYFQLQCIPATGNVNTWAFDGSNTCSNAGVFIGETWNPFWSGPVGSPLSPSVGAYTGTFNGPTGPVIIPPTLTLS